MSELELLFENLSLQEVSETAQNNINNTENALSVQNNNTSDLNLQIVDMAQFKPEYLNCVPNFSGDPNELNEFLSTASSIIDTFYDHQNPNNFLNTYIVKSIQNKLTGNAKVAINIQTCKTWDDLKSALTRNFSDQRDEVCLIRDLVLSKQSNESPLQYFEKCIHMLNLLCLYVVAHETEATSLDAKKALYNKLALKTFLAGLREPLGSSIRAMRPATMHEALQYINEENNIRYCQKDSQNKNFTNAKPNPKFNFPSQTGQSQNYKKATPQKFFTNAQVFGPPKQSQNYNENGAGPSKNVFKPNNNFRPQYQPTPMSISTNRTLAQRPSQGNRPYFNSNRNFVSEELFHSETVSQELPKFRCEEDEQLNCSNTDYTENECQSENTNFQEISFQNEQT